VKIVNLSKICAICEERKCDSNQIFICGLTNLPANVEVSCDSFKVERTASTGKRFANYILDLIFIWIFIFIFLLMLIMVLRIFAPESLSFFREENQLLNYLIAFVSMMIYYSFFEALTGRTLAKFITKTKVINEKGGKPNFKTTLIRTIGRFVPFEVFSFLGSKPIGWHDEWSKTFVVESSLSDYEHRN